MQNEFDDLPINGDERTSNYKKLCCVSGCNEPATKYGIRDEKSIDDKSDHKMACAHHFSWFDVLEDPNDTKYYFYSYRFELKGVDDTNKRVEFFQDSVCKNTHPFTKMRILNNETVDNEPYHALLYWKDINREEFMLYLKEMALKHSL